MAPCDEKRRIKKENNGSVNYWLRCYFTTWSFSVTLETLASGITELPFTAFVSVMQPIHLCIGLVEGIITGAVLCFVYEARPELLWGIEAVDKKRKNAIQKKFWQFFWQWQ